MALARDLLKFSKLSNIFDFTNLSNAGNIKNARFLLSVRTTKHYNPKFKWLRSKKFKPGVTEEGEEKQLISDFGDKLRPLYRYWKAKPLTILSTEVIIDPYVPEIGDGKASVLSKGIQGLRTASKDKLIDSTAIRKIKNYDIDFRKDLFVQEAQDIYINAHKALMNNEQEELLKYTTLNAYTQMTDGLKNKTVRWKLIESLEPPVIVRARTQEVFVKTNLFAQLTVRFHTKQMLAIYDRFGRLMYGNEVIPKDVLEYVVFEKHLNNEHGTWKLLAKIIPEWREPPTNITRTYRIEEYKDEDDVLPEFDFKDENEHTVTSEIVQTEVKPSG